MKQIIRKRISSLLLSAAFAVVGTGSGLAETFDFEIGASDWSGNVNSESTSGDYVFTNSQAHSPFIMQIAAGEETSGNMVMFHDADPDDEPHGIDTTFNIQKLDGENQLFNVVSLDWSNVSPGPSDANLVGLKAGAEVWRLSGNQELGTVTVPTSGSFSENVDSIRWYLPGAAYVDGNFGSRLDNVIVNIDGEAPVPSVDLFDFNIGASDWSGNVDSASQSGQFWFNNDTAVENKYIMQLANGGVLRGFHGDNADGPHSLESIFTVQNAADENQLFTIVSLDWENSTAAGVDTNLVGLNNGVEVWRLEGNFALATVSSPTSGSFGEEIDSIRWYIPAEDYMDDVFAATLDNVRFTVPGAPEPPDPIRVTSTSFEQGVGFTINYTSTIGAVDIWFNDVGTLALEDYSIGIEGVESGSWTDVAADSEEYPQIFYILVPAGESPLEE